MNCDGGYRIGTILNNTNDSSNLRSYLRLQYAITSEHGSWVFLLSPLLIGLFIGDTFTFASFFLVIAVLAAFLIRQPVTIAVKAYSGRRSRADLPGARFWMLVYGLIGLIALGGLLIEGYAYLLTLAIPGLPVFAWHLWLVSRRQERRQPGVEIIGSGVLALSAPAALWVARGSMDPLGWWLFLLTWFQSAASIVHAYLRLQQRELKTTPPISERLGMGRRAMGYTTFNLAAVIMLSLASILPTWLFVPYAIQWMETLYGTLRPAVGFKPTRIGIRQLIISTLFTLCFILSWIAT